MTIKTLIVQIEQLKNEIAVMQVQMQCAGEGHEKESRPLPTGAQVAMLQKHQEPADPLPAESKEYNKNPQSSGVLAMTTLIVSDSKAMEAEAIRQKSSAQSTFKAFVKETNVPIEARSKDIANKSVSTDHYLMQSQTELAFVMTNLHEIPPTQPSRLDVPVCVPHT